MKYLLLILSCLLPSITSAQQQSKSPYLEVLSKNANIPLQSSTTDVQISGCIALVQLTQVYQNNGSTPIEAQYVFPLSTHAAVHDMTMTIKDRIIKATIFEKQQAQKVYNDAIREGKRAAKLDQARPNVFEMKVGNIMPGDALTIDIFYTEMLTPIHGEYQFVAPGVVGPRFTGESNSIAPTFSTPYTKKGVAATFQYDLKVHLNAGMTIQNIHSNSHKINVEYPDPKTASIYLSKSNEDPSNRDFILNYNLRGDTMESGLLLYEHKDEKFFAYRVEPTLKTNEKDIPAREYLFIVDVSGSMNGFPLDVSKELMQNLLCNLRPTDSFNVQLFASSSTVFSPTPVLANGANIEAAIGFLRNGQGGGGTQLLRALKNAYALPRTDAGNARSMVIITDGYVSIEKEAFQLIGQNLGEANVFTFGIGSSVNRYLIEGMARVSNSESFIATNHNDARKVALEFKEYIASPLLTQVKLEAKGFEIYEVEPKSIPDLFSSRPVTIYGKYRGAAKGKLQLTGYSGGKKFKQEFKVNENLMKEGNKALRYLWAREKIARLDDYNTLFREDVKPQVIKLGLQYNLATKYTSFVAVDQALVNADGSLKAVKQPLPMPANVENLAVGAAGDVQEASKFSKSVAISISGEKTLPKAEQRRLKIWFKSQYAVLTQKYVTAHNKLRIQFGKDGKVLKVEILEKGMWIEQPLITKAFQNEQVQPLNNIIQFTVIAKLPNILTNSTTNNEIITQ